MGRFSRGCWPRSRARTALLGVGCLSILSLHPAAAASTPKYCTDCLTYDTGEEPDPSVSVDTSPDAEQPALVFVRPDGKSPLQFFDWSATAAMSFGPKLFNTGEVVEAADYPWQIGIRVRKTVAGVSSTERCGGVLITRRHILTAAHCLDLNGQVPGTTILQVNPTDILVFHGSDAFAASQPIALDDAAPVKFHDQWKQANQPQYSFDAAILTLKAPLQSGRTAPLRTQRFDTGPAVVSGWGAHDELNALSQYLRAVQLPVVANDNCRSLLADAVDRDRVVNETLCTASPDEDACRGDSGGPLVIGRRASPQTIGIVSWGPNGQICGRPQDNGQLVGAYTRGSRIAAWAAAQTNDPASVTNAAPGSLMPTTSLAAILKNSNSMKARGE